MDSTPQHLLFRLVLSGFHRLRKLRPEWSCRKLPLISSWTSPQGKKDLKEGTGVSRGSFEAFHSLCRVLRVETRLSDFVIWFWCQMNSTWVFSPARTLQYQRKCNRLDAYNKPRVLSHPAVDRCIFSGNPSAMQTLAFLFDRCSQPDPVYNPIRAPL